MVFDFLEYALSLSSGIERIGRFTLVTMGGMNRGGGIRSVMAGTFG